MTQWYYASKHNEHQGPVDAATLRGKLERGELTANTLVWREGMAEWQPLSAVEAQLVAEIPVIPAIPAVDASAARAPDTAAGTAAPQATPDHTASPYAAPTSVLSVDDGKVASGGGEIVHAGFWKRAAANMIDSLIINSISSILLVILAPLFGIGMLELFGLPGGAGNPEALGVGFVLFQALFQLLSLTLTATYYAWFHSSLQMATLGKMAIGIKVVRLNGERLSVARAIGRYFAMILSAMTMTIGFIMAGLTQRKQALHDMICDTIVVDKWAFTDRPELQQKSLGAVTITVLVLSAVLFVGLFVFLMAVAVLAIMAAEGGYPG